MRLARRRAPLAVAAALLTVAWTSSLQAQSEGDAAGGAGSRQMLEVTEIRIHGNYSIPDSEVAALAGVAVGDQVPKDSLPAIAARLRDSGRFSDATAQWRYRSLTRRHRAVLLLTVQERLGASRKFLFLPHLHYNEDEGFSAGGRVSARDLFGGGTLISVPVLIGGLDQVALEVSRHWDSGIGVGGRFEWRGFENPFARVRDSRTGGGVWAERRFGEAFTVRAHGDYHDVDFGDRNDNLLRYGVDAAFDTRSSRSFPHDAVLVSAGWQRVDPDAAAGANRYRFELAGYRTVFGRMVLAARGMLHTADGPLPDYERPYVGGMVSLRGTAAGTFTGDSVALGTVELRIPVTSVLTGSVARVGLTAFWDTAAVWDHGESFGGQKFHHGVGGGVYLQVPLLDLNLDVGNNLQGSTRVHFGLGFRF